MESAVYGTGEDLKVGAHYCTMRAHAWMHARMDALMNGVYKWHRVLQSGIALSLWHPMALECSLPSLLGSALALWLQCCVVCDQLLLHLHWLGLKVLCMGMQVGQRKRAAHWQDRERAAAGGDYYLVPPERALVLARQQDM